MYDLRLLEAAWAVIDTGSFERAASRLHVTQSAVSQRIRQLEDLVGRQIIARGTPPTPTTIGAKLIRHYQQVAALSDELNRELDQEADEQPTFKIALNNDSLYYWFVDAIDKHLKDNFVLYHLVVGDEKDTIELLRSGQVAGCISSISQPVHGCTSTYLGELTYRCVSTPAFKKKYFPKGLTKERLKVAPSIDFDDADNLHEEYLDMHFNIKPDGIPYHVIPSPKGFLDVTLKGAAYSLIPEIDVRPYIKRNKLVDLAPRKTITRPLYWHAWRVLPERFGAVAETIVKNAELRLSQRR